MIRDIILSADESRRWWLAGGIHPSQVIAAYQPKGAESLAASYVNLARPGTNNATLGTAPAWSASNGWVFDPANQSELNLGIVPNASTVMLARFSGLSSVTGSACALGVYFGGQHFYVFPSLNLTTMRFGYGAIYDYPSTPGNMVMAINAGDFYKNSVLVGSASTAWNATTLPIRVGARNDSGVSTNRFRGSIAALVFLSNKQSAAQIAALTNAMNAL